MNAILDVYYRDDLATVACVQFNHWDDSQSIAVCTTEVEIEAEYQPGKFYLRELPCLLHALEHVAVRFEVIVVDGYVHLKPPLLKGLGAKLAESLPYHVSVIGVAKSRLRVADKFVPVLRGTSRRPLFVSAVDLPVEHAAGLVRGMSGPFRIPTLIRLADQRCKGTPIVPESTGPGGTVDRWEMKSVG
jgi:deoxyribonuclease V